MTPQKATLEVIAPTVEEAVARGLSELGLSSDAVDVEVLDSGSRGLFGIGGRQVRVRLSIKPHGPSTPETEQGEVSIPEPTDDAKILRLAEKIVRELLDQMKIRASVVARFGDTEDEDHQPIFVEIRGDDLGFLIGRRAEILNALQYIVNLIVGKQIEQWAQIVVDVEGYRNRRELQLRQMARRMADQAIHTGRRQILEPMSAAERRIIHIELRDHSQVTTESIGEEPNRKITIVPK